MQLAKLILDKAPGFIPCAVINIRGWANSRRSFTPAFEQRRDLLRASASWSELQRLKYQSDGLSYILHAARKAPYYSAIHLDKVDDLKEWPLLDKNLLKALQADLLIPGSRARAVQRKSSGTTGEPVGYWQPNRLVNELRMAHYYQPLEWFGLHGREPKLTLGGRYLGCRPDGAVYWNAPESQLAVGVHALSEANVQKAVRSMHRHQIQWIQGHPTGVHMLALLARERGLVLPSVRLFSFTGEDLSIEAEADIREAFQCEIQGSYGQGELVASAVQCPEGFYHVIEPASVIELVPHPSGLMEIVGTSLDNDVMPLIRYKTGDLTEGWEPGLCRCGCSWRRLRSIVGRIDDVITSLEGHPILPVQIRTDISSSGFAMPPYTLVQCRQVGRYNLRLYCSVSIGADREDAIVSILRRWLGKEAVIKVTYDDPNQSMTFGGKRRTIMRE